MYALDIPGDVRRTQQREREGLSGEAGQERAIPDTDGPDGQRGGVHQRIAGDEIQAQDAVRGGADRNGDRVSSDPNRDPAS